MLRYLDSIQFYLAFVYSSSESFSVFLGGGRVEMAQLLVKVDRLMFSAVL